MKFLKDVFMTLVSLAIVCGIGYLVYAYVIPEAWRSKVKESVSNVKEDMGYYEDSGITGEECEIDETLYPYYTYLSDEAKQLYKQIYANVAAMETTFVPVVEITSSEVVNVVNAVYHDHPELFWMESGYSYKYKEEKICVQITLDFNETADDIKASKAEFEKRANEIISVAATLENDYEKEKYVYKTLVESTEYDENAKLHQSPYSTLVYGESVCAGYSRAFQYIMIELGIPTYYCTGETKGHAWNIVKLENGYYNVDLSWADTKHNLDSYFNRTDEELSGSHKRSGYSVLLPKCRSKKYSGIEE